MAKLSEAITGAVFGRLTFIKLTWIKGGSRRYRAAECNCSCGNTVITVLGGLGVSSLSCGCLNLENTRAKGRANKTHGMRNTPTYKSWSEMWARTTNKNHHKYPAYKDRTPPESWRNFEVFFYDMGAKPKGYTLERVRNDLPYGPDNCKWIPAGEQSKNRIVVRRFSYAGKEYILADLERLFGISHGAFSHQHYTNKKSINEIFGLAESELIELPRR